MAQRCLHDMRANAGHGIRPLPALGEQSDWSERALQRTWRSVGRLCMLIGLISALVFSPTLPAAVFLLTGIWAYAKGDPVWRERMLSHVRLGGSLRLWSDKRQVTRRTKVAAIAGISLGGAITAATLGSRPLSWGIGISLVGLCAYLVTRTEPQSTY